MPVSPVVTSKVNPALHGLLATAGAGIIADALTRLHATAQAGGTAAGVAAIAIAAISWAQHSRQVASLVHTVEMDASKIVTPAVVDRLSQVERLARNNSVAITTAVNVAKGLPQVADLTKTVEARVAALENKLPEPVKVAVEDVRPLVDAAFRDMWAAIVTPLAVTPVPAPVDHDPAPATPASDSLVDLAATPAPGA